MPAINDSIITLKQKHDHLHTYLTYCCNYIKPEFIIEPISEQISFSQITIFNLAYDHFLDTPNLFFILINRNKTFIISIGKKTKCHNLIIFLMLVNKRGRTFSFRKKTTIYTLSLFQVLSIIYFPCEINTLPILISQTFWVKRKKYINYPPPPYSLAEAYRFFQGHRRDVLVSEKKRGKTLCQHYRYQLMVILNQMICFSIYTLDTFFF